MRARALAMSNDPIAEEAAVLTGVLIFSVSRSRLSGMAMRRPFPASFPSFSRRRSASALSEARASSVSGGIIVFVIGYTFRAYCGL